MTALAGAACVASTEATGSDLDRTSRPRALVAFFSRSGNTRVVAGLLQRNFAADAFEIRPATPYPDEYLATVEQAKQERDRGAEPALAEIVPDLTRYHTVYLCFPIWGETVPPIIRSFLKTHELAGKTVVPFVTHGGYGLGNSQTVLASHAPEANLSPPFSMQADQERQTMNTVNGWTKQLRALKTARR